MINSYIVNALGEEIASELKALSSEHWQPRLMADQMDAELKFRRERIAFLRKMREDYENVMFGLDRDSL